MIVAVWAASLAWAAPVRYTASARVSAEADHVWALLTDFSAYEDWNPWLVQAEGEAVVGATVVAQVVLGAETRRAAHRVLEVAPGRRLCWRDAGWTTLFVKGRRCRTLEPDGDGVVLHNELEIWGPFVGLAQRRYGAALAAGLTAETEAVAAHF